MSLKTVSIRMPKEMLKRVTAQREKEPIPCSFSRMTLVLIAEALETREKGEPKCP